MTMKVLSRRTPKAQRRKNRSVRTVPCRSRTRSVWFVSVVLLLLSLTFPVCHGGFRGGGLPVVQEEEKDNKNEDEDEDKDETTTIRSTTRDDALPVEQGSNLPVAIPPASFVSQKFHPLSCNRHLDNNPQFCPNTWTSMFGTSNRYTTLLVIPCGQCVFMDLFANDSHRQDSQQQLPLVTLTQGLDIHGKLIIPDGYRIHIQTTHIAVQGILEIDSTKPISGDPMIQISFLEHHQPFNTAVDASETTTTTTTTTNNNANTSSNSTTTHSSRGLESMLSFQPIGANKHACQSTQTSLSLSNLETITNCTIGSKAIIVAGGKVVFNGLPSNDMPTWLLIQDVSSSYSTSRFTINLQEYQEYVTNHYYQPPLKLHSQQQLQQRYISKNDLVLLQSSSSSSSSPYNTTNRQEQELDASIQTIDCPKDGIYFDFNVSKQAPWNNNNKKVDYRYDMKQIVTATLGSHGEYTNDSFRIFKRRHAHHGLGMDLMDIRHCLKPHVTYLFTARIRLSKHNQNNQEHHPNDGDKNNNNDDDHRHQLSTESSTTSKWTTNASTECSLKGIGCLQLVGEYMLISTESIHNNNNNNNNIRRRSAAPSSNTVILEQEQQSPHVASITKFIEKDIHQFKYDQPFTIATEIHFDEQELHPSNIYQTLSLQGVSSGIDLELLDLTFRTAPPPEETSFSFSTTNNHDANHHDTTTNSTNSTTIITDICKNLIPGNNGDAEQYGRSPFPFRTNNAYTTVIVAFSDEEPNDHYTGADRYFQVKGRQFASRGFSQSLVEDDDDDWNAAGLSFSVPKPCILEGALYRIHADVRIHTNYKHKTAVQMEISIRGHRAHSFAQPDTDEEPDVYETLVKCPPSQNEWVSCDGSFTIPSRLINENGPTANGKNTPIRRYEILFETLEDYSVDYDVDNLSFELTEGPLNELIVESNTIQHDWAEGAELLITSYSNHWDDRQVVKIQTIRAFDDDDNNYHPGLVKIRLNKAIKRRPTTIQNAPHYATEVALLSRNILFDGTIIGSHEEAKKDPYGKNQISHGNGAYFAIMHTPKVDQIIQGVEFRNFGKKGIPDRYPIHFDSCGEVPGSVISKNTIRMSNQRCIVLQESDGVRVDGNIAFDTIGHCFVLASGAEVGNEFLYNLGAFTRQDDSITRTLTNDYKATNRGQEEVIRSLVDDNTEDTPATYWISNPSNSWKGNVAAGSQSYGFWMQPLQGRENDKRGAQILEAETDVDPRKMALTLFKDNVAHSNMDHAMKVSGYTPMEEAQFVGFRSYLNYYNVAFMSGSGGGLDFVDSRNLAIVNGIFDVDWPLLFQKDNCNDFLELRNISIIQHHSAEGCLNATEILANEASKSDPIRPSPNQNVEPSESPLNHAGSVFYLKETTSRGFG